MCEHNETWIEQSQIVSRATSTTNISSCKDETREGVPAQSMGTVRCRKKWSTCRAFTLAVTLSPIRTDHSKIVWYAANDLLLWRSSDVNTPPTARIAGYKKHTRMRLVVTQNGSAAPNRTLTDTIYLPCVAEWWEAGARRHPHNQISCGLYLLCLPMHASFGCCWIYIHRLCQ